MNTFLQSLGNFINAHLLTITLILFLFFLCVGFIADRKYKKSERERQMFSEAQRHFEDEGDCY